MTLRMIIIATIAITTITIMNNENDDNNSYDDHNDISHYIIPTEEDTDR